MKQIIRLQLFFLTIFLASTLFAQDTLEIEGVEVVQQSISPFTDLELSGAFNVYLSQGKEAKVFFENDAKVLPNLLIYQRGDKLMIERRENFSRKKLKKYKIFITVNSLEELVMNGVGKVRCLETLYLDRLDLEHNGAGRFELALKANRLKANFTGVGRVHLKGKVEEANIVMDGIGKLDAFNLHTQDLEVERNGIGRVEVHASSSLRVSNNGIGNVRYSGNPKRLRKDSSAIGTIRSSR